MTILWNQKVNWNISTCRAIEIFELIINLFKKRNFPYQIVDDRKSKQLI